MTLWFTVGREWPGSQLDLSFQFICRAERSDGGGKSQNKTGHDIMLALNINQFIMQRHIWFNSMSGKDQQVHTATDKWLKHRLPCDCPVVWDPQYADIYWVKWRSYVTHHLSCRVLKCYTWSGGQTCSVDLQHQQTSLSHSQLNPIFAFSSLKPHGIETSPPPLWQRRGTKTLDVRAPQVLPAWTDRAWYLHLQQESTW